MRRVRAVFMTLALALAVIGIGWPAPAGAAPADVGLTGATSVFASAATFTYTLDVTGVAVTDAVLTTVQDATLPADADSAQNALVDGDPAPAGVVTLVGGNLRFALGALAPGPHTVSFTVTITPDAPIDNASRATVAYLAGGAAASVTSPDVVVPVTAPPAPPVDLGAEFLDGGADASFPVGTGNLTRVDLQVFNQGSVASTAELVVDLPVHTSLRSANDDEGTTLGCRAVAGMTQRRICSVSAIDAPLPPDETATDVSLQVSADPGVVAGSSGIVTITVQPTPDASVEADPADNVIHAELDYTGLADLHTTYTPSRATVVVGKAVTVTATVTNTGPQRATNVLAVLVGDKTSSFRLDHFTGANAFPAGVSAAARAQLTRSRLSVRAAPADDGPGFILFWAVPDLAPGQRSTAVLTLTAVAPGTLVLDGNAQSDQGDPDCTDYECPPDPSARARLTAVTAAPVVRVNPVVVPVVVPPVLAATGSDAAPLTVVAVGLLLGGLALMRAGRRPAGSAR